MRYEMDLEKELKKEMVKLEPFRYAGPRPQLTGGGPANVLIVDDDVDAALLVRSMFARLGCRTLCSLTAADARKKICSSKADIIILDWRLDQDIDAVRLVNGIAHRLDRLGVTTGTNHRRPKIVTYSSLNPSEIVPLDSRYFDHFDHWQKPLKQRDLLVGALKVLSQAGV